MYVNKVGYYIKSAYFSLFELFDRYKEKRLIFPDLQIQSSKKRILVQESIDALLYGIPYPKVYVSELQNGEFLVLETDNRLRSLMEYLSGKFEIEMTGLSLGGELENSLYYDGKQLSFYDFLGKERQDILRTEIQVSILEYGLPTYAHLKIGSYIEHWTASKEEAIRRVLYEGRGIDIIQEALGINPKTQRGLQIEAEFITYLTYVYIFNHQGRIESRCDWYFLQEAMFSDNDISLIIKEAEIFMQAYYELRTSPVYSRYMVKRHINPKTFEIRYPQFSPCIGHLFGLSACVGQDIYDVSRLVEITYMILDITCSPNNHTSVVEKIRNSGLSSSSIEQIIFELRVLVDDK